VSPTDGLSTAEVITGSLPTLSELGPLTDREWRIYALAYNAGREDGFDYGLVAGARAVLDADTPAPVPGRRPNLRLIAS
jgi:hypothetical protein